VLFENTSRILKGPNQRPGNNQGKPFSLTQVKQEIYSKFWLPQSEQQALSELREIKQRDGESAWEYNQIFKDVIGKLETLSMRIIRENGLFRGCYH
jgi:hypothetical protein